MKKNIFIYYVLTVFTLFVQKINKNFKKMKNYACFSIQNVVC